MSDVAKQIAENVARVRERIARAAFVAGRSPETIRLVAVTKYVGPTEAAALLAAGCDNLGESRPQQLWEKAADERLARADWHLIGPLQRNKVRRTLPCVKMIHSIDSQRLLEFVDRTAGELGMRVDILLEVNCSGDTEKKGLMSEQLQQIVPLLPSLEQVRVCGLMTMAAREGGAVVARKNFAALRALRDSLKEHSAEGEFLPELSMGMSHDFEEAILEGATLVRIGSALLEGVWQ